MKAVKIKTGTEAAIEKWQREINTYYQKIRELQFKMDVAKEIAAMTGAGEGTQKGEATESSLPQSMLDILKAKSDWLSAGEIYNELIKSGWQTRSEKAKLLVATTLNKMAKRQRVHKRDEGNRKVKYASPDLLPFKGKD